MSQDAFERQEEARLAALETAENTSEMKGDLKTVIRNQNDYIDLLKKQNDDMKQILEDIFGSSSESKEIQNEILTILQNAKPTDGIILDKGLDFVVQAVFAAVQLYLKSKGILF